MSTDWRDFVDPSDLAGMGRGASPLEDMGYDPEEVRANPALRQQVMDQLRGPLIYTNAPGWARAGTAPAEGSELSASAQPRTGVTGTTSTPAQPAATAQALPKPAVTGATSSAVQPVTSGRDSLPQTVQEALSQGLKGNEEAQAAARPLATSTGPDTTELENKIYGESTKTPLYDPQTGKMLAEDKPTGWQRFGRGVRSAAIGLLTGGIPGAVVGAIEPQDIRGGTAYGAPNAAYSRTEAEREQNLALDTQRLADIRQQFKDQTDARKAGVTALGDTARNASDLAKGATDEQNAQTNQSKNITQLREHGLTMGDDGTVTALPYDQLTPEQQADYDLKKARTDYANAQAEVEKEKNDPNSPAYKLAVDRLNVARQNAQTAIQRLGLSTDEFLMHSRGTDANGNALPGAMLGADGQPVGTAFQQNVRPTGTQRDAAGRAVTMDDLQTRIEAGLRDPEITKYMGPMGGRLAEAQGRLGTLPAKVAQFKNDLVSYGAFQAGLHPVRGIGALEYFDRVMGGLAQTPEQLEGKLASNRGTSQSVQHVGTPKVATGTPAAPATTPAASTKRPGRKLD